MLDKRIVLKSPADPADDSINWRICWDPAAPVHRAKALPRGNARAISICAAGRRQLRPSVGHEFELEKEQIDADTVMRSPRAETPKKGVQKRSTGGRPLAVLARSGLVEDGQILESADVL